MDPVAGCTAEIGADRVVLLAVTEVVGAIECEARPVRSAGFGPPFCGVSIVTESSTFASFGTGSAGLAADR
jgi:hypothetical protein